MARSLGSRGRPFFPSATCFTTCGGGNFSNMVLVSMLSVLKPASRASSAWSSIFSGCNCCSIHFSRPQTEGQPIQSVERTFLFVHPVCGCGFLFGADQDGS